MLQDARQYWRSEQYCLEKSARKKAPLVIHQAAQKGFINE
jgi:hypothetical protein